MTASEFAFLALGLVLGVASGSALVMVLGARPPAREVRLTVERDAVPRRAATLSSDAFVTATAEPARGGPADRRREDREDPSPDQPPSDPMGRPVPVMASVGDRTRTTVPFGITATAVGRIPIAPERDPAVDTIRVQAALAAERLYRTGMPTATALLDTRAEPAAVAAPVTASAATPQPEPEPLPAHDTEALDATAPALVRILRGDHQALFATTAALAGLDSAERRPWHAALLAFVKDAADRAIGAGWLDVPVGNPFWDTFTLDQCRLVAASLAAVGYRFDGIDGWEHGRVPSHRELTMAVASAGIEPRRIRAWPTQEEIAGLYREVTVATDDFLAVHAPALELDEVQAVLGTGGPDLARLWASWDRVRDALKEPVAAA